MTLNELVPLFPLGVLLLTALVLLMLEVFAIGVDREWAAGISVAGASVAWLLSYQGLSAPTQILFSGHSGAAAVIADPFAAFSALILIAGAIVACLLSPGYVKNARCASGEYYALMLLALVGMLVMVMAGDLITFFLGLEVMSVAVYVLTGIRRNDSRAPEAALKYFLMGAFATGFLLFGIAFIYGATQSVTLTGLSDAVKSPISEQPMLAFGLVLVLIGFAFKIAAVPFHVWAPDVYEGAPTPITGFMAVGVKAAAFLGLLRLVISGLSPTTHMDGSSWADLLRVLAIVTILAGNAMAIVQRNIKRMLAYSSISHAGYALIGIVAASLGAKEAGSAVLYYLGAYTFMTLGAFGVLAFLERKDGGSEAERFGAFAGVGYKHPALGLAMSLFMIALAGMPPTGGFLGKLYLFSAAIEVREYGLVLVGICGSVMSVYYYLRVIVAFYMRDVPDPGPLPSATRSHALTLGIAISALLVIQLGVYPGRWLELGRMAIRSLQLG